MKDEKPRAIIAFPGIGNVGTTVMEYILNNFKTDKIGEINSDEFPAILIGSEGKFKLPSVNVYKIKDKNIILFAGDAQPSTEAGVYRLSEKVAENVKKLGIKDVTSLGGIGLNYEPKNPKIYVISNSKSNYRRFQKLGAKTIDGNISAVFGMNGVVFGVLSHEKIRANILLAETSGQENTEWASAASALQVLSNYLGVKMKITVKSSRLTKHSKESKEQKTDMHYIG